MKLIYQYEGSLITYAEYTYDAWGSVIAESGTYGYETLNPLRYRGYYFDTETGFYYLQSRYYDPALGRFINADSYASTGQGFLGYNMFAYCGNRPLVTVDFFGDLPNTCQMLTDSGGKKRDSDLIEVVYSDDESKALSADSVRQHVSHHISGTAKTCTVSYDSVEELSYSLNSVKSVLDAVGAASTVAPFVVEGLSAAAGYVGIFALAGAATINVIDGFSQYSDIPDGSYKKYRVTAYSTVVIDIQGDNLTYHYKNTIYIYVHEENGASYAVSEIPELVGSIP